MRMRSETVGAFIDALYGIAVTILALDIPSSAAREGGVAVIVPVLVQYGVAFALLFSFWVQHRRINGLVEEVSRAGLWTTAGILMLVCLVPRATSLVFEFGGDVTVGAITQSMEHRSAWTTAEGVDLFYVGVVLLIDLGMFSLLLLNQRAGAVLEGVEHLRNAKLATTAVLFVVVSASFLLPVENRYFLLAIPILLFFETELSALVMRFTSRRAEA